MAEVIVAGRGKTALTNANEGLPTIKCAPLFLVLLTTLDMVFAIFCDDLIILVWLNYSGATLSGN